MKRIILYDLDGTLVDTREDITQTVLHMLATLQAPPLPPSVIQGYVGQGLPYLVQQCLSTTDPARVERGLAVYRAHYAAHMMDHTALYPHAAEALEYFRSRVQAVVTNKSQSSTETLLRALGIAPFFHAVLGAESGYPRKPDPSSIRALLSRLGLVAADALLVGDSVVDIETGRNAGILTVAVRHGFGDPETLRQAAPDLIVADFREFLREAGARGW